MSVRILHLGDSLVAVDTPAVAVLQRAVRGAIDHEAVLGIDSSKLRDLADSGDVPEAAVFDTEERTDIRRQDLSVEE